jgi:hypothetical protein
MPLRGLFMKPTLADYVVVVVFGIAIGYFFAVYFTGV